KLKANQDTVDLIDGRVSSLGTEVNAVAGQISNKVWKTDIESAVDGIAVGGRNLIPDSEKEVEIINTTTGEKTKSTEKFKLEANQTYTFSAEIFIDDNVANSRTQIHCLPTNIDYYVTYRTVTPNNWTKITW